MSIIYTLYKALECLICDPISEAQRDWRKDHILNKNDGSDWRNEQFWR